MLEDMNNKSWQCEITSSRHHLWKFAGLLLKIPAHIQLCSGDLNGLSYTSKSSSQPCGRLVVAKLQANQTTSGD